MSAISFANVWENYRIKFVIDGKASWEDYWALRDVSFSVEKGEVVGIIGENGAGKSTVLKIISGMIKPDRGQVEVSGRVSGLLELGAGFQPELTGSENIRLQAAMFGLAQDQIDTAYPAIVEFANLGRFIYAPVKCYSQGMYVRLAFSIAIHVDADILLIDDTLAVGDEYFQKKCMRKIFEQKEKGKTIVFVTHDMQMLQRLATRALLLREGRLVKDGSADKVLPLYVEALGPKGKVGILEENPLHAVFNNGRLFINWHDRLLTPSLGAHTSFLISDKWYTSLQADWQVRKESERLLTATGESYQVPLRQTWRLELERPGMIRWSVEIESSEPLDIQEGYANLMLAPAYARWETPLEKGVFPPVDESGQGWHNLLAGDVSRTCAALRPECEGSSLPPLIFEELECPTRNYLQVLNTDYYTNCRVVRFRILGLQGGDFARSDRRLFFSGRIALAPSDIEGYLREKGEQGVLSAGAGGARLFFENGQMRLSFAGRELTRATHLSSEIYAGGTRHYSALARWEVQKHGAGKMVARGRWPGLALTQVWEIEADGDDAFLWKVALDVQKEMSVERQHLQLVAIKEYNSWFHPYGSGFFGKEFHEHETDVMQRCIPDGYVGLQSDAGGLPALVLEFNPSLWNFAKIFNSDFYNKGRILRIDRVEPEDRTFAPGSYPCFAVRLSLRKSGGSGPCLVRQAVMERGKLRFAFERGSGRLFWEGIEITKGLGFYTSLRSMGRWHDSFSSTLWHIETVQDGLIAACGTWMTLPVRQRWKLWLGEHDTVGFEVSMRVEEEIRVDRLQANLMVSEKYTHWFAGGEGGSFSGFSGYIDDDWQVLYSFPFDSGAPPTPLVVKAAQAALPAVAFAVDGECRGCLLNVVNSDLFHRGRVLQCLRNGLEVFLPGDYTYCAGTVTIGRLEGL